MVWFSTGPEHCSAFGIGVDSDTSVFTLIFLSRCPRFPGIDRIISDQIAFFHSLTQGVLKRWSRIYQAKFLEANQLIIIFIDRKPWLKSRSFICCFPLGESAPTSFRLRAWMIYGCLSVWPWLERWGGPGGPAPEWHGWMDFPCWKWVESISKPR